MIILQVAAGVFLGVLAVFAFLVILGTDAP